MIDTILIDDRSWRGMSNIDGMGSYADNDIHAVSHHNWGDEENLKFSTENIAERIVTLHNGQGKDIWLFSGGELISMPFTVALIDEMQISDVPVILGNDILLFPKQSIESKWILTQNITHRSGGIKVTYKKNNSITTD